MLIAHRLLRKDERTSRDALDSVTLDSDGRHRRRARVKTDGGRDLLIDLSEAASMREGDALETESGLIEIHSASEPLLEITAHDGLSLARAAWHLGNRHTAVELTARAIYIQPDHVLEHMLEGLGARVKHVARAFEPESGAYGHGHDHHHD